MITLTKAASEKIKEMMAAEELENNFLRIGVKPGGCSGFSYAMGFDDELQESDREFEQHDVKVVIDSASVRYLEGVEIDYKDSGMGGGFVIHNPNAVASCGCGSSFRTATDAGQPTTEC
jgi:iron-sulfur cluster assembly protein